MFAIALLVEHTLFMFVPSIITKIVIDINSL